MTELLLQLANTLGLLGLWIVGRKRRYGFLVWLGSEVIWAAWGYAAHSPGILPWVAIWSCINCANWWRWRRG